MGSEPHIKDLRSLDAPGWSDEDAVKKSLDEVGNPMTVH